MIKIHSSSYITIDAETVSPSAVQVIVVANGLRTICTDPTSSVLFDDVIPTLTGLDGDWASQLLTLQRAASTRTTVLFDFTGTQGYVGLTGVEVVMFNCLEERYQHQPLEFSHPHHYQRTQYH